MSDDVAALATQHDDQLALFEKPPSWESTWRGMPEFNQRDLEAWQSVIVHFASQHDRDAFAALVKQTLTDSTKYIWYPAAEQARVAHQRWASKDRYVPRYPIYIVSKGRWESRLTAKALDAIGVDYFIVVEPQEFEAYASVIERSKVLVLPFSNLGQGSIPARNWIWEHSLTLNAKRHWILDDNIDGYIRLRHNMKIAVTSAAPFCMAEDFADRYTNVGLCGFNYHFFAKRKQVIPPYVLNTRIYSNILIKNDLPFRWRGRYNEDTDLSIRVLKSGKCTVLFNAFLAMKAQTMTMAGGNTDELYQDDGRLKMAQSLKEQHPDCVNITWRFKRHQHVVDYGRFASNKLELVLEPTLFAAGDGDYGLTLEEAVLDSAGEKSLKERTPLQHDTTGA